MIRAGCEHGDGKDERDDDDGGEARNYAAGGDSAGGVSPTGEAEVECCDEQQCVESRCNDPEKPRLKCIVDIYIVRPCPPPKKRHPLRDNNGASQTKPHTKALWNTAKFIEPTRASRAVQRVVRELNLFRPPWS